ncbi:MAG: tRNA lysidine(34) synthetase TilS [Pyrinomonadaceae bacterium]
MDSFVRNLLTEWRRLDLPFSDATVVAAVSGGADSVSLLLALHDLTERKKLKLRIVAAHFDHRLRPNSGSDVEFVRSLANKLTIELSLGNGDIPKIGNIEQNAREARYTFLRQTAESVGAFGVLTAHTVNDQTETFLMNLLRGSGPGGLGGMRTIRELEKVWNEKAFEPDPARPPSPSLPFSESNILLIRPLLRWAKRSETENFCRIKSIEYRYDTMNEDLAFTRVRIRKILIPMLESFNPGIIESLARTASLMQAITDFQGSDMGLANRSELPVKQLLPMQTAELFDVLRKWLEKRRGSLRSVDQKHIEAVGRLVTSRKSGKTVEIPGGGIVTKTGGFIEFEVIKVVKRAREH